MNNAEPSPSAPKRRGFRLFAPLQGHDASQLPEKYQVRPDPILAAQNRAINGLGLMAAGGVLMFAGGPLIAGLLIVYFLFFRG